MKDINSIYNLGNIQINIFILKIIVISLCTYFLGFKLINKNIDINIKLILQSVAICIFSIICGILKYEIGYLISIICLILLISILFAKSTENNIGNSIMVIIVSMACNYILFTCSVIVNFIFNMISKGGINDYINFVIISTIHILLFYIIWNMRRLKNGISFLKSNSKNENIDILVLNICIIILISNILLANYNQISSRSTFFGFIIFSIIMFIIIQKSLQLYYKQKLLIKELNETKEELNKKNKEIEELERENLNFSKKSHTIAHKQKALEYKINELLNKRDIEASAEELKERVNKLSNDLYKDITTIELDKTDIEEIDDMLKYMKSECMKNNIDLKVQIKDSITYMVNNIINKEDLETLIADHVKNAIIAINHTDNVNKSILVKIGKIENTYGLYIYDSGIEFEEETLKNLGKKPSTTHKDEGGTGMGFMNTFDTLRKYNASLIIDQIGKPSKENYTKAIIIKFDGKTEFKVNQKPNV